MDEASPRKKPAVMMTDAEDTFFECNEARDHWSRSYMLDIDEKKQHAGGLMPDSLDDLCADEVHDYEDLVKNLDMDSAIFDPKSRGEAFL